MTRWIRRHPFVLRAIATVALLLVVAWGWVMWLVHRPPRVPVSSLFPGNPAASLRILDLEEHAAEFSRSRGYKSTSDGVRAILEASGAWSEWTGELGEREARAALAAALNGVFNVAGAETRLVAGEWSGADDQTHAGAALITRADSLFKWRAATLARLVLGDQELVGGRAEGVGFYSHGLDDGISISLMNLGGWLVVSAAPDGSDLPVALIRQYRAAERGDRAEDFREEVFSGGFGGDSQGFPLQGKVQPAVLDRVAAAFDEAKERSRTDKGRKRKKKREKEKKGIHRFAEAMEGIDVVDVALGNQSSTAGEGPMDSLNLEVELKGPRITGESRIFPPPVSFAVNAPDHPTTPAAALSPPIIQMDFDAAFARGGADMLGLDWDEITEDARDIEWVRPDLLDAFARMLRTPDEAQNPAASSARVGFAFYPTLAETIPAGAVWEDQGPPRFFASSPADAWRMTGPDPPMAEGVARSFAASGETAATDTVTLSGLTYYKSAISPEKLAAKRELADRLWRSGAAPPLAFIAVNFDELAESMHAFPAIVLKKKDQERWVEWRDQVDGLAKTVGAFALRLDRDASTLNIWLTSLDAGLLQDEK